MTDKIKVDRKTLHARTCTANEWFDALDLEKRRDQDYALISICIVDGSGKLVYTPEDVGKLSVTTYARLYEMTLKANRPENAAKK